MQNPASNKSRQLLRTSAEAGSKNAPRAERYVYVPSPPRRTEVNSSLPTGLGVTPETLAW